MDGDRLVHLSVSSGVQGMKLPAVTNGFEIEIIVRSRTSGNPTGKSGHVVITCDDRIGAGERQTIAKALSSAATDLIAARRPQ